jgi:protocatechuate 3,4-dioxygenase beta subunit
MPISRRQLLITAVAAGTLLRPRRLRATPAVPESEPSQEGPFYKAGAPERSVLREPGMKGTPLTVTGRVLSTDGTPINRACLDVWHADDAGDYDNQGFRLRGKLYTNAQGEYTLKTFVPRSYKAGTSLRAAHIHLKVSGPGHPLITTEIYFKGNPDNYQDGLIKPALLMKIRDAGDGKVGQFQFVLKPEKA